MTTILSGGPLGGQEVEGDWALHEVREFDNPAGGPRLLYRACGGGQAVYTGEKTE